MEHLPFTIPFDYPTLKVIWWLLLGILLGGFAVMDGFDMGAAANLWWLGRHEDERRLIINAFGPVWDGNQVWLILGAGAIFAAWPTVYATSFSGFYFAMLLVLLSLILRPVSIEFRSKLSKRWHRLAADIGLTMSGVVPPVVFGVAFGNLFQGVPFSFDDRMLSHYTGTFLELLNPFGLLCGVASFCMLAMHGAVYLVAKTRGPVQRRARTAVAVAGGGFVTLFLWAGQFVRGSDGYVMTSTVNYAGPANPLLKTVAVAPGAWLANYQAQPLLWVLPVLVVAGALLAMALVHTRKAPWAFAASGLSVLCTVATCGATLFPFILPSSTNPSQSLTVWDSSSSQLSLFFMLVAAVVFVPIVLFYTAWVFRVLRAPVTPEFVRDNADKLY